MPKYECTVIFDASASVTVEAYNPEDAAIKAEDELQGRQHLCHQCADQLETGDSLGVHVYDEECKDQLLDTTYKTTRSRVVFPTMLRKMWSGGEVQAWLDENVNKEQS